MGSSLSGVMFQPPRASVYFRDLIAKESYIWLTTASSKRVPAFYIDRRSSTTILFSHGNAEDIRLIYDWFDEFSKELQVNFFAYEYEGYADTVGQPGEKSCYEDADAAYKYLTEILLIKPEQLVLYGRSLGSGPSCYLAERLSKNKVRLGGLILQSPVLSIYRVAFNFRFTLLGDMFCNIDRMPSILCPVFVIHGTKDEIVPFWNGEELFEAVQKPYRARPLWVQDGGHNNLETLLRQDDIFFNEFREFLTGWLPSYQNQRDTFEISLANINSKY
jgi:fermentation-respiration switch protein FrsA (DUF1100 family)